jgi:hypothetical protein
METKRIADVLLERPTGFELAGRHFYLYPQTLGSSLLIGGLLAELNLTDIKDINVVVGLTRIVGENLDTCLRIIAYSVLKGEAVLENESVTEVMNWLRNNAKAEDIVMLMQMILSVKGTDDLLKHFGIDEELKEYSRICQGKDDSNTIVFCGKSVWGSTIHTLAEKYGWTKEYILWHISLDNVNMLLADMPKTIYLTEDEIKRLHPKRATMRADDPANFDAIMAMKWD